MSDENVSEIVEEITEAAEEIIEERAEKIETAEEINRALLDAMLQSEEYRQRIAFEERMSGFISELQEGLTACRNELASLSSEVTRLSATVTAAEVTAEVAQETAETSLILQASNLPSEVEGVPENQMMTDVPVNPEIQESQADPPAPLLRKLKRRLL